MKTPRLQIDVQTGIPHVVPGSILGFT